MTLQLIAPDGQHDTVTRSHHHRNSFCQSVCSTAAGHKARQELEADLRSETMNCQRHCERECFAGLAHVAIPIRVNHRHVATVIGGEVFRKSPTKQKFHQVARLLRDWEINTDLAALEHAYFNTHVLSAKQYRAAIMWLHQMAEAIAHQAPPVVARANDPGNRLANRAIDFMRQQFTEKISAASIARCLKISESHLCRVFKTDTGMTITDCLGSIRVDHAKKLLADCGKQIKCVARESGFPAVSHFNRVFKARTGMSPTQYRRALLAGGI
jgi:AraC-like DNA-binding protein/ligand-binding sensor protein